MTEKDIAHFKSLIIKSIEETEKEIAELKASASTSENGDEHSAYASHMAELGTDMQEREKSYLFADRLTKYLKHLNLALVRIENKTFGICQACGKEIDHERLNAVPHTQTCVDCKMKGLG